MRAPRAVRMYSADTHEQMKCFRSLLPTTGQFYDIEPWILRSILGSHNLFRCRDDEVPRLSCYPQENP